MFGMMGGGGGGGGQADLGAGSANAGVGSGHGTALPSAMAGATQSRGDGSSFFDAMLNSLYGVWQQRQQPQEQAQPQAVTQPQQQPQQSFTFQTPEHLKKYFQVDAGTDPRPQYGIGGPYG